MMGFTCNINVRNVHKIPTRNSFANAALSSVSYKRHYVWCKDSIISFLPKTVCVLHAKQMQRTQSTVPAKSFVLIGGGKPLTARASH